jgi:HlyD family secretion protein
MIFSVLLASTFRNRSSLLASYQCTGVSSVRADRAWIAKWGAISILAFVLSSCNVPKSEADAKTQPPGAVRNQAAAVDVAIAAAAPLAATREYTGTTQPLQEVAIRAQAEGQLRQLNVDVGDRVKKGQTLARIDDSLLVAATAEAAAELASRRTEISQLQAQVSDAKTQVEQNRLQLQQAQSDAARYSNLAKSGAVSQQQAEQFRTQARTAAQVLQSAQAKVLAEQQAIGVANSRITAQQAVVAQQQQRRAYAMVMSPLSGAVLSRSTEQGNVVQVGNELLRLGDFSQAKVTVQVSELDLATVRLGGAAKVRLDAFPKSQFAGKVTRISPAANPTSRLVPVEVTIPNPTSRIGSGLLARVSFAQTTVDRVVVPLSALQEEKANPTQAGSSNPRSATTRDRPQPASTTSPVENRTKGTLFIVTRDGEQSKVTARSVALGQQIDGKVQILSGLNPGERFVSRTSKPLKDGDPVRVSILSAK